MVKVLKNGGSIFVTALNLLKKYIFYDKIDGKDSKKASQYRISIIQVSKDFIII